MVGGKEFLNETKLKLAQGRKYGLIGRNGIGKTCFMNALVRKEFQDIPEHIQILLVEQEISGIEKTPLQYVIETDTERLRLLNLE